MISKHATRDRVVLCLLAIAVLLPSAPPLNPFPCCDSGVFLYTGQRILQGAVPYQDVWDHKPPAIHYLNALGLWLSNGTTLGVWVLQVASLLAAVLLSFRLFAQRLDRRVALPATAAWLLSLILVLQRGNLTEEYGLPLQFGIMALLPCAESNDRPRPHDLLIGILAGLAFLLRPNQVGMFAAAGLYVILSRPWRQTIGPIGRMGIGLTAVLGITAILFAATGALDELVDAVFTYNAAYVGVPFAALPEVTLAGLGIFMPNLFAPIALVGWGLGVRDLGQHGIASRSLVTLAVLDLPLEIGLSGLSGRIFPHYFIPWLPACAVLIGVALEFALRHFAQRHTWLARHPGTLALILIGLFPLITLLLQIGQGLRGQPNRQAVVEFIQSHSTPQDRVLIWGNDPGLNFSAQRAAPGRFGYVYPLLLEGYQSPALAAEFLDALSEERPPIIIDTSPENPYVPALDLQGRQTWESPSEVPYRLPPELADILAYFDAEYRVAGTVGDGWPVYLRED